MLAHYHFELIVTAIIAASSGALFGYWFRYTCLLILSAKTAIDYTSRAVEENKLSLFHVQARLRSGSLEHLDLLHEALERDYSMITRFFNNAIQDESEQSERRMLKAYYRLTSSWFHVTHILSPENARQALEEMSNVVAYLANAMGEQAACAAAA